MAVTALPAITTIKEFPENPKTLILQQCKTPKDLHQIHAHLIKTRLHLNPITAANLLESAAIQIPNPSSTMDYAISIFDKIDNPNTSAYNIMIRAFTLKQTPHNSIQLMKQMLENGLKPDEFTFPCVLKACSRLRALNEGQQIHTHLLKSGVLCDSRNALIHFYACCGKIHVARKVFDKMSERDSYTWSSMFSGYCKNECWEEVLDLFNDMCDNGVGIGEVTLISVLTACGRVANVELGEWIHEYIEENRLTGNIGLMTSLIDMYAKCGKLDKARKLFNQMNKRDVVAWSAMISGYTQAKRCNEALDLFREMQKSNVDPNEVTLVSVLSSCSVLGIVEWIHSYIKKKRMKLTVSLGTAIINCYAKCGLMEKANEIFEKMKFKNVYTWTALIHGLACNGQGKKAIEIFNQMRKESVEPNDVTFIGVLSACSHVGLVEQGREFFNSLSRDFGIEPKMEHYGCMVDILGRAGFINEAYRFIKSMPKSPNVVIWRTLLASCRAHKNVEMGEESLKHIVNLEPMHSGDYIILSNIYASVGRLDDAMRVRNQVTEKGIKKPPGFSAIELDGEIYEFLAEDNSKEIYEATDEMMKRIKSAGYVPNLSDARIHSEEDDKESSIAHHSEKLAIAFGLIKSPPRTTIRITKNLRVCSDCHNATKIISKVYRREIIVRDRNRFHHFKDGLCSCNDFW